VDVRRVLGENGRRRSYVLRVPKGLDPERAAPLMCAGITTYSPLRHSAANEATGRGHGLGRVGHMAVKLETRWVRTHGAQHVARQTGGERPCMRVGQQFGRDKLLAPAGVASCLAGDVLSTVTSHPSSCQLDGHVANTAQPMTATRSPRLQPNWRRGEYVVMPAHMSGAARSGSAPSALAARSFRRRPFSPSTAVRPRLLVLFEAVKRERDTFLANIS